MNSIILSLLLVAFVTADLRLDGGNVQGWDVSQWYSQVDGVMGGKSSGYLGFEDSGTTMSFTGVINLDGGGFSSVRKKINVIDLSQYSGIVVQLEATDKYNPQDIEAPLGLHLQFHDRSSSYAYASAFAIPLVSNAGEVTSVYLPLDSFDRGSRIGYQCRNCALDTTSIDEMDIYVLFQSGPFNVRVKSITAVDNDQSYASPVISIDSDSEIKDLIQSTIKSGGSLYDKGYPELCIAIYRSTLNSLIAASGDSSSDTMRAMACEGINRANTQDSKVDIAWSLRWTMDGILENFGFLNADYGSGWRPNTDTTENMTQQCNAVTSFAPEGTLIMDTTTEDETDMEKNNEQKDRAPVENNNVDNSADENNKVKSGLNNNAKSGLNNKAKVGLIVGLTSMVAACVLVIALVMRRRNSKSVSDLDSTTGTEPPSIIGIDDGSRTDVV